MHSAKRDPIGRPHEDPVGCPDRDPFRCPDGIRLGARRWIRYGGLWQAILPTAPEAGPREIGKFPGALPQTPRVYRIQRHPDGRVRPGLANQTRPIRVAARLGARVAPQQSPILRCRHRFCSLLAAGGGPKYVAGVVPCSWPMVIQRRRGGPYFVADGWSLSCGR